MPITPTVGQTVTYTRITGDANPAAVERGIALVVAAGHVVIYGGADSGSAAFNAGANDTRGAVCAVPLRNILSAA